MRLKSTIEENENIINPAAIILDGNQRSAMAATRSLGRKGIDVVIGAETRRSLASSSRYQLALGEKVEGPAEYRIDLKSRWELGDFDHLLIRLKRDPDHPSLSGTRVRKRDAVAVFLADFLRPSVAHEVFECGDPGPFLFEAKEYVGNLVSRT